MPPLVQHVLVTVLDETREHILREGRKADIFLQIIDLMLGIVSLSETPTDLLMWAHYADAHQGYVLGLKTTDRFFRDSHYGLRQVQYNDARPTLTHPKGFWYLRFNLTSSHPLACKWLETKRKGHIFELRVCQSLLLE